MTRPSPIALTMYALALFAIGFFIALQIGRQQDDTVKRTQVALGTLIEIQVRGMERVDAWRAMDAAFAEIRRVDTLFSTYTEGAPVWSFNHTADSVIALPSEVIALMRRCDTLTRITGGAFDIAVEELVRVWGFDGDAPTVPDSAALAHALARSGWTKIRVNESGLVEKSPGVTINFGAVAKGYAVDRAVAVLELHGVHEGLVNAGGEVRATGGTWSIGIQHPRSPSELVAVIDPCGRAVATSGDYEQYFEQDNRRYHHIFDPATGMPARSCQSVTVLAADDLTADALATAVFVMGPRKGMEFLQRDPHIEGMIIDEQGVEHSTPGFATYRTR
ncbi:MAG: FAD:protein FMN transferase [Bacteroidetes bacterium]|nr:FAD:protein FMN transferase [Bacteroidota bacterium]